MTVLVSPGMGPDPDEPSGETPRWRLSVGRQGLELAAGRHLQLLVSLPLAAWLAGAVSSFSLAHRLM